MLNGLLVIDGLPYHCLGLGVLAHVMYYRVLHAKRFPYVDMSSTDAVLALVGFVCNGASWIVYFWNTQYTIEYIAAFVLMTTCLVPFALFLSLGSDQDSLPGAGGYPYRPSSEGASMTPLGVSSRKEKKPRGLALRVFDVLRRKRNQVMPDLVGSLDPSFGLKEKI